METIISDPQPFQISQLLLAELVTDYFFDLAQEGVEQTSTSEIMAHLGFNNIIIDKSQDTVYDVTEYRTKDKQKSYEILLNRFMSRNI